MTLRVGIDVSPLAQTRAGTARYVRGLLRELSGIELERLAFRGSTRAATLVRDVAWYPLGLPRAARRGRADVVHCTTYRGPLRGRPPLVVTVHDLAVLRHPEAFNRWTRTYSPLVVPRVLAAARRIVAVSEFTRRELVELLRVPDEKSRVVPNAVEKTFAPDGPAADGDYVLAVGTLEPRKNLPRLAAAARALGVELRVAGARGWGDVDVAGDGVRWLGEVADEELPALYRGALCVAFPSLYEGFGIPVLEAMACGAAVVTSRGTAMEEVAGPAAVLVDPRDVDAIAGGIEQAIARRDELSRLGPERARAYSWRDSAARAAAVYRELA